MTKICNSCGIEKDISEYGFRNDLGKYRDQCKLCWKETHDKWVNRNRDKTRKYGREFYNNNKEKQKAHSKSWQIRARA